MGPSYGEAGSAAHFESGPVLSEQETRELIRRAQAGDAGAREALVAGHVRLVWHLLRRFPRAVVEEADLFQTGCLGLLLAIERFNPDLGVRFSTYAVPTILGELRRAVVKAGSPAASRRLFRLAAACRKQADEIQARTGRAPTLRELAGALGESPDELLLALEATRTPLSLDAGAAPGDEDPLLERLGEEDAPVVESLALRQAMAQLPPRERRLLQLRFVEERTQSEVGELLGISQVQVSRLERRILARIRAELAG